jgi:hypothetical protein
VKAARVAFGNVNRSSTVLSPLNIRVLAGAAALIVGIFGGAYVAGSASPDATTPVLDSVTPSRVASPSAVPTTRTPAVKAVTHAPKHASKHEDRKSDHAKKKSRENGNNG